MTSQHSLGPWEASISVLGEGTIFAGGDDIALVYITDGADEPTTYPAAANAKLIACAVKTIHDGPRVDVTKGLATRGRAILVRRTHAPFDHLDRERRGEGGTCTT